MSLLIKSVTDQVRLPQYGAFALEDQGRNVRDPGPLGVDPGPGAWFQAVDDGAGISSEHGWQEVGVQLELWDGLPRTTEEWDKSQDALIYFTSGKVAAVEVEYYNNEHNILDLGRAGAHWNVRALMRQLRPVRPEDSIRMRVDLEAYLFQFWPA
ncbi:hypothetical protein [Microbispora catharanthi]|uniref:Uncharacterized protein n=1 Tax=Microbispora catharanthi TaxID=1712871 RepID=A0A5N6BI16_9ACTN|nr:hypothetical protein [Microbispora catharanthi]KAB8180102.1 hypothetical protein FH610_034310 [Microbispora catharanthi]